MNTDPILLAELMAIRSLILNLFAAASKGPLTDESGSGKSSAIWQILRQIAQRGRRPSFTIRRLNSRRSSTRPSAAI